MGWDSEPRDAGGNIIHDPSDDELPPNIPGDISLAQESSPTLELKWYTSPNPNTPPNRPAPSTSHAAQDRKAPRVDSTSVSKDDQDLANRHAMAAPAYFITASEERAQLASKTRLAGILCPLSGGQSDGGDPLPGFQLKELLRQGCQRRLGHRKGNGSPYLLLPHGIGLPNL